MLHLHPVKQLLQHLHRSLLVHHIRLNRDSEGVGGISLYILGDIPSNLLAIDKKPIASVYVELNQRNKKYLINCSCNPHKAIMMNHLPTLSKFSEIHWEILK